MARVYALADLPRDRLRNYLWCLARGELDMLTPGERRQQMEDRFAARGEEPSRADYHRLANFERVFHGPYLADILAGSWKLATLVPDTSHCFSVLGRDRLKLWAARVPAYALRGAPKNPKKFAFSEKRRLADLQKFVDHCTRRGEQVQFPRREMRERQDSTWHYASEDGRILCCDDVRPVAGAVDVLSVAPSEQCPNAIDWPPSLIPWHHSARQRRALRRVLVEASGARCQVCKVRWATKIDHDHGTGRVRGYLCTECNLQVDGCPHPDGCAFARYLNSPPALSLELTHPGHRRMMRRPSYRRRAELFARLTAALGVDLGTVAH